MRSHFISPCFRSGPLDVTSHAPPPNLPGESIVTALFMPGQIIATRQNYSDQSDDTAPMLVRFFPSRIETVPTRTVTGQGSRPDRAPPVHQARQPPRQPPRLRPGLSSYVQPGATGSRHVAVARFRVGDAFRPCRREIERPDLYTIPRRRRAGRSPR